MADDLLKKIISEWFKKNKEKTAHANDEEELESYDLEDLFFDEASDLDDDEETDEDRIQGIISANDGNKKFKKHGKDKSMYLMDPKGGFKKKKIVHINDLLNALGATGAQLNGLSKKNKKSKKMNMGNMTNTNHADALFETSEDTSMNKDPESQATMPILILKDMILFPNMAMPIVILKTTSVSLLENAFKNKKQIICVRQLDSGKKKAENPLSSFSSMDNISSIIKDGIAQLLNNANNFSNNKKENDEEKIDEPTNEFLNLDIQNFARVGCVCSVKNFFVRDDNTVQAIIEGQYRAEIVSAKQSEKFLEASIQRKDDLPIEAEELEQLRRVLLTEIKESNCLKSEYQDWSVFLDAITDGLLLLYIVVTIISLDINERQKILETDVIKERFEIAFMGIQKQVMLREQDKKVRDNLRNSITQTQKEHILREQMKILQEQVTAIQKELKDTLEGGDEIEQLIQQLQQKNMPEAVAQRVLKEANKLKHMHNMSSEYSVIRHYLEWFIDIPWEKKILAKKSIKSIRDCLNKNHYGMEKIKNRILDLVATQNRVTDMKGAILCLVGSPGTGKTSLAQTLAEITDREFAKISFGGVRDKSEICGHRKTYVGAAPGSIIKAMTRVKTSNPIILLDEIDKMSYGGMEGDPASALLEVVDMSQNHHFVDHYLEVPYDLSHVLFIATANSLDHIPLALYNRLEIIELSGYSPQEKKSIAMNYLLPKILKEYELQESEISVDPSVIDVLIERYCMEAGVRQLNVKLKHLLQSAIRKQQEQKEILKTEEEEKMRLEKEKICARCEKIKVLHKGMLELENESYSNISCLKCNPNGESLETELCIKCQKVNSLYKDMIDLENEACFSETCSKCCRIDISTAAPCETTNSINSQEQQKQIQTILDKNINTCTSCTLHPEALNPIVLTEPSIHVTPDNLTDFVGSPIINEAKESFFGVGISTGLSYSAVGGGTLTLEAVSIPGKNQLILSGSLGDVMKESAQIARVLAYSIADKNYIDMSSWNSKDIYLHAPAGSVPKDGPSAGCALCVAFLSLITNKPTYPHVAMTGEVTLTGRVLQIGGLKEKFLGAIEHGIKKVLIPYDNRNDLIDIPDEIKSKLDIIFIQSIYDVIPHVIDFSMIQQKIDRRIMAA